MQAIRSSTLAISRRAFVVAPRASQAALFSTSRFAREENPIKETAQKVNKVAGEALLKGVIEPAEKVSQTVKAAVGSATAEASQKANELKADASQKASEVKADANQTANNVKADANQAANRAEYEAKTTSNSAEYTANDLKEDVKGAATNAGYTADQVKAEVGKKVNNVATEFKKATQ